MWKTVKERHVFGLIVVYCSTAELRGRSGQAQTITTAHKLNVTQLQQSSNWPQNTTALYCYNMFTKVTSCPNIKPYDFKRSKISACGDVCGNICGGYHYSWLRVRCLSHISVLITVNVSENSTRGTEVVNCGSQLCNIFNIIYILSYRAHLNSLKGIFSSLYHFFVFLKRHNGSIIFGWLAQIQ